MQQESLTIIRVIEDHHVLEPGGTLSIPFSPDEGPGVITVNSSVAPDDVILGGSPNRLIVGAQAIIDARLDPGPLSMAARASIARDAVAVSQAIGPVTTLAAQPDFGLQDVVGGGVIGGIDPVDNLRLNVIRPPKGLGQNTTVLSHEVSNRGARSFTVDDIPALAEGFAPSPWIARFTNISNRPLQVFGRILFRERRTVEVHTLPIALLRRLLRQTLDGLGLSIQLRGSEVSIDFDHHVKALTGLQKITEDIGFNVFGDVNLSTLEIDIGQGMASDGVGPFPQLSLTVGFEENGPEISLDLGTDIDINLSDLKFHFTILMRTRQPRNLDPQGLKGDHPLVPFLAAEIDFDTDIRFSSRTLGVAREFANGVIDVINGFGGAILNRDRLIGRIPTLAQVIRNVGQKIADDFAFEFSQYLQVGLNRLADREKEFHGVRVNGDDWDILTGPVFSVQDELPVNAPPVLPLANPEPIDGPQSNESLENLNRIDHFVVLMMENRSYDHTLGWRTHPDHGNDPNYNGLTGVEINRIAGLDDASPRPMQTTKFFPSPPHGFEEVMNQIDDGRMTGFGTSFKGALERKGVVGDARSIMNFNTQGMLPVYDFLSDNYAISNNWFAGHPGPTWPNRFCTLSGLTPILRNEDLPHDDLGYIETPTLFDLLDEQNINWRCYESDVAFLRMFKKHRLDSGRIRPFERFENEALAGLPPVTIIEPSFVDIPGGGVANDDHPGGADMINGQRLIAQIYNVLIRTPGWRNTLFVITYDEHGGFFDHVPPPGSAMADQTLGLVQKVHSAGPNMLGVRVPAFFVSPRSPAGMISSRIYDHASIAKTIIARFLPGNEHNLSRRVETAAHMGEVVPLAQPRTDEFAIAVPAEVGPAGHEDIEAFSFHDDMSSLGNPMRQDLATLQTMLPKLRPE